MITALILLLQIESREMCNTLICPQDTCYEAVFECATDGETVSWCFDMYLRNERWWKAEK